MISSGLQEAKEISPVSLTSLGHLALRDPTGRGVWIKRSGISLGEVAGPENFVLVDFAGNRLAGEGSVHKGWPIHTEIMQLRPDVIVAGHSHPFHATVFSALDVELAAVTNEAVYLGGPSAGTEKRRPAEPRNSFAEDTGL